MKHLTLKTLEEYKRKTDGKKTLFMLDFDGTISPLAPHPNLAVLPKKWKQILRTIFRSKNLAVAIVTGREHDDIAQKLKISGITIASHHGFEINRTGRFLLKKGREFTPVFKKLGKLFAESLADEKGVVVEQKKYSTAIHYRLVPAKKRRTVIRKINKLVDSARTIKGIETIHGKMVIEIRPKIRWNKGYASQWISKKIFPDFSPIYIGDDTTDEDAFRVLKNALTIRVGKSKKSHAKYYVRSTTEVLNVVNKLMKASQAQEC